jgi:glycosyltransferase involved in cell wall biosynthesis
VTSLPVPRRPPPHRRPGTAHPARSDPPLPPATQVRRPVGAPNEAGAAVLTGLGLPPPMQPELLTELGQPPATRLVRLLGPPDEAGPAVLDWHTGLGLEAAMPEYAVFTPPDAQPVLPYLDGTIDVVVLDAGDPDRLAEARRVARLAVVTRSPAGLRLVWLGLARRPQRGACPDFTAGARRVLLCAPRLPEFDRQSGSRRMFEFLRLLTDAGVEVTFLADTVEGQQRYAGLLRRRGVPVYTTAGSGWPGVIGAGRFDLVVVAFWHLAERLLPVLRAATPAARVVVDSVDLAFVRSSRQARLHPGGDPGERQNNRRRELATYAAADAVLTVSETEAALLRSMPRPPKRVFVVPDGEDIPAGPSAFGARRGIVFVANFWHQPNIDALDYLADEITPRLDAALLAEHPLLVVGSGADERIGSVVARIPHARLVGWVPSVVPYLHRARVAVLPLRYGAGTKRKLIQALFAGVAAVSTTVGAEGLPVRDGAELLIADDPAGFAAATTRLLTESGLWQRLTADGRRAIAHRHDRAAAADRFAAAIHAVPVRPLPAPGPADPAPGRRHYSPAVLPNGAPLNGEVPSAQAPATGNTADAGRVLVVGVVLAEHPNNAPAVHAELAASRRYAVDQRWAGIGRYPDGLPGAAVVLTVDAMVPKYLLIERLLRGVAVDEYDYLLVCDDDVLLPTGFLDRFLELQRRCGFCLAQPARTETSFIDHPIVQRQPGLLARRTLFVESGPVFSVQRSALPYLLPFPTESPMGWGYEEVWSHRLDNAGLAMGIVDDVSVEHLMRPTTSHYRWEDAQRARQLLLAVHPHRPLAGCLRVLDVVAPEPSR